MLRAWDSVDFVAMLTMFGEDGQRSRSHGLRPDVVAAQANRLGLEQLSACCSWSTYTDQYVALLAQLPARGITHVVFGDIAGDAHRAWNERVCAAHGLTPVMPLWGLATADLVRDFIAAGGEALIVTARPPVLDESWLGAGINERTVARLERLGVDPCGELGEYHTVVTNCARFSSPLTLLAGERVLSGGCWALDVHAR
jgi:uncharacterized protein (TIGR00290 family)